MATYGLQVVSSRGRLKEVEVVQLEVKALDSEQVEVLHIIGDDNDDDDFDILDHFRYVLWHGLD